MHFKPLGIRRFSHANFQKLSYFKLVIFQKIIINYKKMWKNECVCKIQPQDGKLKHDLLDFFSF